MDIEYNNRPDYRNTVRYSTLPNNQNISMSNVDLDRGMAGDRWNYGIGFSKPLGYVTAPYSNRLAVDNTQYIMSNCVYNRPRDLILKMYKEDPQLATPEQAKLNQGEQTINNR